MCNMPCSRLDNCRLVVTTHKSQQLQKAGQKDGDGDIQGDRGHNVVRFAAMDDMAAWYTIIPDMSETNMADTANETSGISKNTAPTTIRK